MSVNMSFTIEATTATELSRAIRELASIIDASAQDAGVTAEPTPTAPTATETATPAAQDPVGPATQQTVSAAEPETAVIADKPAADVSMEDVRAKLAELVQAGKQAEVKALLSSFGATKLSDVPAERYGELMAKAGEIG